MNRRLRAGLTLIELMVTVAIFSILMLAALSIFVAMSETQRLNERVGEASANRLLALSAIQLDLQNAGYRVPVPAFALRIFNNVDATLSLPSNGANLTTAAGCGPGGVIAGTDILEVAEGPDNIAPGRIETVVPDAVSPRVTLNGLNPMLPSPTDQATTAAHTPGPVLVFARGPAVPPVVGDEGAFCMGRITDPPGATVTVRMMDLDGNDAPPGYYANCPVPGMRTYRILNKTRYMVCGTAAMAPNERALYQQRWRNGVWEAPRELQTAVENLQAAGRYLNLSTLVMNPAATPSCIGGGARALCYCNDGTGACAVASPPAAGPVVPLTPAALIRGARVQITATGDRVALSNTNTQSFRRPASFDLPAPGGAGDNFVRFVDTITFSGSNFLVVP